MLSALPEKEHREVVEAYRLQALGFECHCGAIKRSGYPVCDRCGDLLSRAGFAMGLYNISYYAQNHKVFFESRAWHLYEAVIDVAHALRTGLWDGKRLRKAEVV